MSTDNANLVLGLDNTKPQPEQIAARAYAKFEERGFIHGFDVEDWTAAEAELRSENQAAMFDEVKQALNLWNQVEQTETK